MASHDGKRRSHQRFLRNLPKQKPGKYLKVIQSSVADPELEQTGRGQFFFCFFFFVASPAGFTSFCDSFLFLPKIRRV